MKEKLISTDRNQIMVTFSFLGQEVVPVLTAPLVLVLVLVPVPVPVPVPTLDLVDALVLGP